MIATANQFEIRSEADERCLKAGFRYDEAAATRVFRFFEKVLKHSKGKWAGKPFILQEWQRRDLLGPLFGWKRPDGTRRYRRAFVEIPKKNGKSTLAAGVGLYMLIGDDEAGAEVYSCATRKDQASIVHSEAINMVKRSPVLSERLKVNHTTKTIYHEGSYSKYGILASDAGGAEGLNIHCLIADELHVWKGRAFWDSLRYGSAVRDQPLAFVITTAGIYDNTTLGWQEHEYATRVLSGDVVDDEYFAYIACADPDDDYLDPATHKKANPSYGVTIDPIEIEKAARDAKVKTTERGPFLRYRLNIWSEEADSFFDMEKWRACSDSFSEESLIGRACYAGLDLASRRDVTAWVLLFPPSDSDPMWRVLPRLFVPKGTAKRREAEDGVKYATWGQTGEMILTGNKDDDTVEYGEIVRQIVIDCIRFAPQVIGADPWQMEALRQQVFDHISDVDFIEIQQTFRNLSEPTKQLEAIVVEGKLAHGGNEALTWMAGNCVVIEDGLANFRMCKKKSRGKIDGISALVMAVAVSGTHKKEEPSVYTSDRGLISL